jgi:pilus assembly protein TadC
MWLPVVAIVGCCVVLLMLGPLVTVAVASAEVFATMRLRALHRVEVTDHRPGSSTTAVEVPAALDVLAACLFAGSSLDHALTAVAEAFGGGVQATLAPIARLAAWGAPVETAWAQCLALPRWAPVARAVIRASYSGATLADVLTQQAVEYRRALRSGAAARAQRAGVSAVLPLGLCFLPAFVLAGIVPVVAGFAEALRH